MSVSSFVESIEYIEVSLDTTSTEVSYNLTKGQNYENCVPFMTAWGYGDYYDSRMTDMYFSGTTESGVINFRRWDQRSNQHNIQCYVIEFNPEEVAVQQGSFDITSITTDTITLPTAISGTNEKAAMTFGWRTSSDAQYHSPVMVRGRVLSDGTQIDFYRNNTNGQCDGHWFLFEDKGDNFRVVHKDFDFGGNGQTVPIYDDRSTVDLMRTFLLGSFATSNTSEGYQDRGTTRMFIYSNGSIRADRAGSTYTIYCSIQIVSFLDQEKVYVPYDHYIYDRPIGTSTLTRDFTVNSETRVPYICEPDTSTVVYGCMQGLVRQDTTAEAEIDEGFMAFRVTASGTYTYKAGNSLYEVHPSYTMVVDWAGIPVVSGTNSSPIPEGSGVGQSFVKSVENFRVSIEDHVAAYTLTKGQDVDNCVIFMSTHNTGGSNRIREYRAMGWFEKPHIALFKCWGMAAQTVCDVSVVEFWPDQVKVQQRIYYTHGETTSNVSIDVVSSLNKTFVLSSTFDPAWLQYPSNTFVRTTLTSTTNIELYKNGSGYEIECSLFVVEDLQDNFFVQHFTTDFTGTVGVNRTNDTIWPQDLSFILVTYATNSASDYPQRNFCRAYHSYPQRPINVERYDGTYTIYYTAQAVKFLDQKEHTFRSVAGITSTTYTYTLPTNFQVNFNALTAFNAVLHSTGRAYTTHEGYIRDCFVSTRIINDDTLEFTRGSANVDVQASAFVVDWIGTDIPYAGGYKFEATPTKSVVRSVERQTFNTTDFDISVYPTKGQDIDKCVPFMTSSVDMNDDYLLRAYKSIYRFNTPDPGKFSIIYGSGSYSENRDIDIFLVEFGDDIKVQYGHKYSDGTSTTVSIEEVNLDRAFLHFYAYSDTWQKYLQSTAICGHFNSSTELEFIRSSNSGTMYITWYVIECPDDDNYWRVQHLYNTNLGSSTNIYAVLNYFVNTDRTMFLASWTNTSTSDYPQRNFFRMYHRQDDLINFNRYDGSYNMDNLNVEVVEILDSYKMRGFRVISDFMDLSSTTSDNISLKVRSGEEFRRHKSMLINGNQGNESRVDSTYESYLGDGFIHLSFDDEDYYTSVTATNIGSSAANIYGFFYAMEWPEPKAYYVEGNVVEQDLFPVERKVRMYRADTGEIVDETTSASGTGYFKLETTYSGAHYVVCLDDEGLPDYNDLIYGRIYPAVIEGCFRDNEGLV